MNRLLSLAVALIIALTSQQLALARGQGAAAGEMVICTGGGFMSVAVDTTGKLVGPAHICPDGALALAATAAPVPPSGIWYVTAQPAWLVIESRIVFAPTVLFVPSARAPPVSV